MSHKSLKRKLVFGLKRFARNTKGGAIAGVVTALISLIVVAIAWLAMTPTIVTQVQGVNTTGWTFTGYEGAIALLGLIPFAWVGAGLTMLVVGCFALVNIMKNG